MQKLYVLHLFAHTASRTAKIESARLSCVDVSGYTITATRKIFGLPLIFIFGALQLLNERSSMANCENKIGTDVRKDDYADHTRI